MQFSFSDLRAKEVINVADGKKLGKICDVVFCYPENKILGFVVPGNRGIWTKKNEIFFQTSSIVKLGEDVVLVQLSPANPSQVKPPCPPPPPKPPCPKPPYPPFIGTENRRSYDEYE